MSLEALRKEKGLTTTEVAKYLGISQGHYSHLENGTRNFNTELISKLSEIFEVEEGVIIDLIKEIEEQSSGVKHWLAKIRIRNKTLAKAFLEDLKDNPLNNRDDQNEIILRLADFVQQGIKDQIIRELEEDDELLKYLKNHL
jgi:transcriptional regulator with XRE-family HTH domain